MDVETVTLLDLGLPLSAILGPTRAVVPEIRIHSWSFV